MIKMGKIKWMALAILVAHPSISYGAQKVGQVLEASGGVNVTHEVDKKTVSLAVKDTIFLKDIIETKKDGVLKISFLDGTTLVLREKSKMIVTDFLLSPKKDRHTVFDVMNGKLKAETKKRIDFKTPTAVVGVRGTEIALEVLKKATKVYCLKGLLEVFNLKFPDKIVQVAGGNFTNVLFGKLPELPIPIPREVLDLIESQFGFPTSLESLKQRGLDELRSRVPIPF